MIMVFWRCFPFSSPMQNICTPTFVHPPVTGWVKGNNIICLVLNCMCTHSYLKGQAAPDNPCCTLAFGMGAGNLQKSLWISTVARVLGEKRKGLGWSSWTLTCTRRAWRVQWVAASILKNTECRSVVKKGAFRWLASHLACTERQMELRMVHNIHGTWGGTVQVHPAASYTSGPGLLRSPGLLQEEFHRLPWTCSQCKLIFGWPWADPFEKDSVGRLSWFMWSYGFKDQAVPTLFLPWLCCSYDP